MKAFLSIVKVAIKKKRFSQSSSYDCQNLVIL